jgi:predicted kinase
MTVGIPSSGKTTLREKMLKTNPNLCILSADDIRERMLNSKHTKNHDSRNIEKFVWEEMKDKRDYCINEGFDIFFDATNVNESQRKEFLIPTKQANYTSKAIILNVDPEVAFLRQKDRERKVPKSVMYRMYYDMEIPTKKEFDSIQFINKFASRKECDELKGYWIEKKERCKISRLI